MAKRTRYAGKPSGRRPGTNRTLKSVPRALPNELADEVEPNVLDLHVGHTHPDIPTGAAAVALTAHLTQEEIERAAELEAEATARERAAISESIRRRARSRMPEGNVLADVNAPLSVRAAHEYAYVARDVRRILLTGGLMVLILAVLHILVNVMGVLTL